MSKLSIGRLHARLAGLRKGITLGTGNMIHHTATLALQYGGSIRMGSHNKIYRGALVSSHGGEVVMGSHCTLNPYSILYGHGGLRIGDWVRIAAHCVVVPMNHEFDRLDVPIAKQGVSLKGVVIEDDVWIGANVVILDGVTIAKGSVIGAGSVVTRSTQPYSINVGAPARFLKQRGPAHVQ